MSMHVRELLLTQETALQINKYSKNTRNFEQGPIQVNLPALRRKNKIKIMIITNSRAPPPFHTMHNQK